MNTKKISTIVVISLFITTNITFIVIGYNDKTVDDTIYIPLKNKSFLEKGIIEKTPINTSFDPMDSAWPMLGYDQRRTGRSPYAPNGVIGVEKWIFKMDGKISSSPAIDKDGIVYIGVESMGTNGVWYSFFALTPEGKKKWSFDGIDWVRSSPAIAEDGTIYFGSLDHKLYAINPDGSLKWKFNCLDNIFSSPAIADDGTIYITITGPGWNKGRIYAINPNGTERWYYDTEASIDRSPAIDNEGIIYIGSKDYYMYALYPNGTLKWKYKTNGEITSIAPTISDDGIIYFGSMDGYLYALNPNGSLEWRFYTEAHVCSSPSLGSEDELYFGCHDGKVYCISAEGTLNWRFGTGGWVASSPAIDNNGIVYVGSFNGNFYAINPDGSLRWKYKTDDIIESSPAIGDDGTIYFGSWDEYVYAIEVKEHAPNLEIDNVRSGFCYLKADIKNIGDADALNVECMMSISESNFGNQKIKMNINKSISLLEPGMSETIRIGPVFAFGESEMKIQTRSIGANPDRWSKYCWIIGPFILIP